MKAVTRKLVIGYDPDHAGFDVLCLGDRLAGMLAAKPVVVTALPWPTYLAAHDELQRMAEIEMATEFDLIKDRLHGLEAETLAVPSSSPARALHEAAEAKHAKLIVLGSCHRGGIGRTLAGSVGESLAHGAPCAIAIAPRGYAERDQHRLLRIAVAFDGSPESWTALETGIGLAERCHGYLTVCTVADFPKVGFAAVGSVLAAAEIASSERADKERLLELALSHAPDDLACDGRLLTGYPGAVLSGVSDEYDLLITGSRSYGPLRRTLLGSTSRRLIGDSRCPVLVVPRGVGVDPLGVRPLLAADARQLDEATR